MASPSEAIGRNRHVVAGLFAGIGGLEKGLAASGHHSELLCEIDPLARAVLEARFPGIPLHDDVCTLERCPAVDLLAGGFRQTSRRRGARRGSRVLVGARGRGLPAAERAREVRAPENVPHASARAARYDHPAVLRGAGLRWAYRVVDARSFGLPQRRQRVFFLAMLEGDPRDVLFADDAGVPEVVNYGEPIAFGFYWTEGTKGLGWAANAVPTLKGGSTVGVPSPPAVWLPSGEIVTVGLRDAERLQGFPADWTPGRVRESRSMRWKLVGNAVSVPVARWLGRRLARPGHFQERAMMPLFPGVRWPHVAWNTGEGRFTTDLSMWPVRREPKLLHEFSETEPLSARDGGLPVEDAQELAAIRTGLSRGSAAPPRAHDPPRSVLGMP
jgi:DNA (cytosine-5)-methyltransferase 1